MLFYSFNVITSSPIKTGDAEIGRICRDVLLLNEKQDYNVRFYVCNVVDNVMDLAGVIGYKNTSSPEQLAMQFVKDLGFAPDSISYSEITTAEFKSCLRKADKNNLILDNDEIEIGLNLPSDPHRGRTRTFERMAEENLSEDELLSRCSTTALGSGLRLEIERIFSKRSNSFIGHPVHYAFISDDIDDAMTATGILASALYSAGRLRSRRIDYLKTAKRFGIRVTEKPTLDISEVSSHYRTIPGGTIVLVPDELDYESETADPGICNVDELASEITEHRRDCLTVLIFSKSNMKSLEKLKSCLDNIKIVDIMELPFEQEAAKEMLRSKASEDHLENFGSLLDLVDKAGDRAFYPADINRMYNTWLDNQLCSEYFSQYNEIESCGKPIKQPKGDAYKDLQRLVGLARAKKVVNQALDFNRFQVKYHNSINDALKPSRHMVFTGNPGTAKTTVARLFAQIMKDNQVLSRGDLIEVGRQDLVGKYVGWTARLVEEAFNKARGSVLFIDEAYSLCDDRNGLYGDEAINTIVQLMENRRDDTIVIFAGYPDKMKSFLERNPGLRSRIAFHVDFDDYNEDELMEILSLIASNAGVELSPDVDAKVRDIVRQAIQFKDFGNGRFMRNMFERARMAQASRIMNMNMEEEDNDGTIVNTLIADDFDVPDEIRPKHIFRQIGFAG